MTTAPAPTSGSSLVRDPWIKSVRAQGRWQGGMATRLSVRGFELRSDEPEPVGGNDTAPTPMEIVAGAVNACITVVAATVAAELGIELRAVETESAAHMDVRGFRGTADVSPHFRDYRLLLRVTTDAAPDLLETLRTQTEKRCPAFNLVRDAGVPIELVWEFVGTDEAAGEVAR